MTKFIAKVLTTILLIILMIVAILVLFITMPLFLISRMWSKYTDFDGYLGKISDLTLYTLDIND